MPDRPEISRHQIQSRASSQSFARGESYYHSDAISHTVRRDNKLEGRCRGSYPKPYRVWAELDSSGIIATGCNCEYDWGGDCKHIVALLLTYLHTPDQFDEQSTLQDALMSRSREDLVDIIELMVARYPDLQDIVDRPTPNEVVEGIVALDTQSMRQELREALHGYGYEYYDDFDDTPDSKVHEIATIAKRFSERGDWSNAAAVYRAILEEFSELNQDYYYDEDGELGYAINQVVEHLDNCLTQPTIVDDTNERRAIIDALIGVFIWDVNFGGIDIGAEVPDIVLKYVRREDIPAIRQRVEAARDHPTGQRYGNWAVETCSRFLMDLDMVDEVDPEILLKQLQEQGMYRLLVDKLLEMQRPDEAADVIRREMHGVYEWRHGLSLLVDHGHDAKAQLVAEDILEDTYDYDLAEWLIRRYQANDNKRGLLRWQLKRMYMQPSLTAYAELQATAQALNQWDDIHPKIVRNLQANEIYDVLTRVYLHDEKWAQAWETLSRVKGSSASIHGLPLDLEVADASCHAMPERAIPVFIKYAHKHISLRNRGDYQSAANLLSMVQVLYDQLGDTETWKTLIADIRAEFKRLRALQDELNKAGL